ncbi:MAG: glycosyltransferase, partial [Deltaproteobacteria bacterium]|nr:glycosyltransferase [Deltaproteobacteria bacterium]
MSSSPSTAPHTSRSYKIQLIVPIYNEGENVISLYRELQASGAEYDTLRFVHDQDTDTSLPFIAKLRDADERVAADKNQFGRGVVKALRWGFSRVQSGPAIVIMGDCSDKLDILPDMVRMWERGATIVSPSRYMRGGEQHGGGLLKSTLSRVAGLSLKLLGFPTADATNNFKLYDGDWLKAQEIESTGGFEIAIELCYKAYAQKKKIVELPTVWRDRTAGESNFKLWKWLPRYLGWYFKCIGAIV